MKMDMSKLEKPEAPVMEGEEEELDLFADEESDEESSESGVSLKDASDEEFEAEARERGYELDEEHDVEGEEEEEMPEMPEEAPEDEFSL